MSDELWRPSLKLALHRNRQRPESRLVQLATVGPRGRPTVRTLAFRRFLDDPFALVFTTDSRSAKRAWIDADPRAAACWYFPVTREQFRIAGRLSLVGPDSTDPNLRRLREEVWSDLTDEARIGFTWPSPGTPRDPAARLPDVPPDPSSPVDVFLLATLAAEEVDHLELEADPQRRWIFQADARGRWTGREVNP